MFATGSYRKKMEEQEQWAREEEEWTMRRKKEEDVKLRERRGQDGEDGGASCLGVVMRNLLLERGLVAITIAVVTAAARAAARMRSLRIANRAAERDERDLDNAQG
jgi:hypothetical protein